MIERIVVPLDGSLTAEAILPQIRRLLYRNDSEVILVRAVEPPFVENAITLAEAQIGAAREYVLGQQERLEKAGVRVSHVVRLGSPSGVILDVVEERKATMVAMATHGASGLQRFLFGSVAEAVIRRCPVPVLVVRPFWTYDLVPPVETARRPIRNLLLPLDGSDRSLESLPGVMEFADLFEARIVLLRVLEKGEAEEEARRQMQAVVRTIEKEGVETLMIVESGNPVEEILKAVRFREIDLIAMATHGRTGILRASAGSVTEEVLRKVTVPMLVTRCAGTAEDRPGTTFASLRL
jgi:nucleotide-binding universal stress UspA family protein